MGLFGRKRAGGRRGAAAEDAEHLRAWAAVREGVEAFVEPRTAVTETTMILVAKDGAWTRRRVAGPDGARKLARSLKIPVYDVQLVGYPRRMRDHDARQRVLRERERRRGLGELGGYSS
ncbi:oxidoreductase [Pseudonocardia sp. NPDC049154]|uniref:oxidoreductase n=1 Tax=Pseudonocardia sp. NPDC049154 TaxID=3155501 RepID=UPI00340334BC